MPTHSRVIRADELRSRHCGRWIKIGDVTGELVAFYTLGGTVRIEAIIGGSRAHFGLTPDCQVEHWRKEGS